MKVQIVKYEWIPISSLADLDAKGLSASSITGKVYLTVIDREGRSRIELAFWDEHSNYWFVSAGIAKDEKITAYTPVVELEPYMDETIHVGDELINTVTDERIVVLRVNKRVDDIEYLKATGLTVSTFLHDMESEQSNWVKTGRKYPEIVKVLDELNMPISLDV